MKRNFIWAVGFIFVFAVVVTAIFGSRTFFSGSMATEKSTTEPEPVSITLWTDQAELFLEYPPLVVGHAATFAAHLTDLRTFQPVIIGPVEIRLTAPGKAPVTVVASAPLRPGIFTPSVTISEPGTYEMEVALQSDSLRETFQIPNVQVFSTQQEIDHQAETPITLDLHEEVIFLKEQQWKVEFATKRATKQNLASTITARGTITAKMGQKVVVTAPITGLVVLPSGRLPVMGQHVAKNEVLVAVAPGFLTASRAELESALSQAAFELEQAEREFLRAQRLYAEKILAKRRIEQAKTLFLIARNKHGEAQKRLAAFTLAQQVGSPEARDPSQDFLIRAPLEGKIAKADLTLGARVEAGEELFTLINLDRVWLEAHVYASDVPNIATTARAAFRPHGMTKLISPDEVNSRLVTIGNVIDSGTKTLPVIFEVQNPNHILKVGMHADVFIETGERTQSTLIPASSVLQENGKNVVFVQTGGETFEKRYITTGIPATREGEEAVQILEGIQAGERVVTKGAYAIKLAAASGDIPTHSH